MNFRVLKIEGDYWGVFIVNPNRPDDPNERYLLTSPLTRSEAEHFRREFERLDAMVETLPDDNPYSPPRRRFRLIRLED